MGVEGVVYFSVNIALASIYNLNHKIYLPAPLVSHKICLTARITRSACLPACLSRKTYLPRAGSPDC